MKDENIQVSRAEFEKNLSLKRQHIAFNSDINPLLPQGPPMPTLITSIFFNNVCINYFLTLIENIDCPGNFWLIDLPANGTNVSAQISMNYDFDTWDNCFITSIQQFQNVIYVGHSFSGMFPLLFPQLEQLLSVFIIFNSAPSLWLEEANRFAKENNLPSLEPLADFENNPNNETFKTLLL